MEKVYQLENFFSYHETDIEDFKKKRVWLWCQWIVEGIWSTQSFGKSFPV